VKNLKKVTAVTMMAGGFVAAGTGGASAAGTGAQGVAAHSPGVGSGNVIQIPVEAPVNLCGNSVNLVGALNPAFGNHCANK